MAIDKIFNDANVDGIADNIFGAVNNSVSEVKAMQQRKAAENVQMVVEAFKKIETNITEKFDNVTDVIEKRVLTIKDGRDGSNGSDGRNGRDGKPGRDGVNGKQGPPGTPGKDGTDGIDGVSVTNANIDFDGSLVISLSSGQQINVGEVVPPELERQLVELRQGGGSAGSSGDVMGPTSSTDNAIARFDGTTGKLVQNSVVTIADTTGNMAGVGTLGVGAITTTGALVGTATQSVFNTVSTTLNIGGAATAVNIGAATGTLTVANTTLAAKAITASTTLAVTGTSTLTGAVTATAGVTGPLTSSSVAITGGSITGITDLAVADGGTGASTAAAALNNLLPSQTSAANKYLQSDGTNASWDAVSLSTADITGTLGVANGGTGQTSFTNGQLLIGNSTGNTLTPATLTAGSGVTITNGSGAITVAFTGPGAGSVTSVDVSGGTTGLTTSGGPITSSGTVTLAGTLAVANGGTSLTTLTANNVILGNGTSTPLFVAPSTNGNVLTSNGTTWASTAPAAGFSTSADNTFTGTQSFAGTSAKLAEVLTNAAEVATVSATAATGTINYDVTTQSVLYYTSNASANWTVNFRASSGTSLNTAMSTGQSVTAAFLVTQGATAYYNSVVQVDGSTVTPKYQGGTAYAAGNASSVDVYMYTIVKTGNAAFTVFTSQTKFA